MPLKREPRRGKHALVDAMPPACIRSTVAVTVVTGRQSLADAAPAGMPAFQGRPDYRARSGFVVRLLLPSGRPPDVVLEEATPCGSFTPLGGETARGGGGKISPSQRACPGWPFGCLFGWAVGGVTRLLPKTAAPCVALLT